MNKETIAPEKARKVSGKTAVAKKVKMTPLQTIAITMLMTTLLFISVSSMVTYGSNRRPSQDLFKNSQTISVLNA